MIAGMGFAQMAWRLALKRTYQDPPDPSRFVPMRMTEACQGATEFCEHCEYFHIIDKAYVAWNLREKGLEIINRQGGNFDSLRVVL